jgi:hypothetical protein
MNTLNFSYFPAPPIEPTPSLVPLVSWHDVVQEIATTGIEFDGFWLDSVREGVAFLFSWHGRVRATVLAVWEPGLLRHVECRTLGDTLLADEDADLIEIEVRRLFALVGFRSCEVIH